MDSRETDVPVWTPRHVGDDNDLRRDTETSHEARTADAAAPDEDVLVIESHETDDQETDSPIAGEGSSGTIWSAGPSGEAEPVAPETAETEAVTTEADAVVAGTAPTPSAASAAEAAGAADAMTADTATTASTTDAATGADAQRWSEIKAMFVDDPGESVRLASGLVERAIENLTTSLRQRQESLASWEQGDAADTEGLRNVLRSYRSLFEQLEGMSGQFRPVMEAGQTTVSDS